MEARRGEIYRIPRQEMGRLKFVAALIKVGSHLFPVEQGYLVMEKADTGMRSASCQEHSPSRSSKGILPNDAQRSTCPTVSSGACSRVPGIPYSISSVPAQLHSKL